MIFRSTTALLFCGALGLGAASAMAACAQTNTMTTITQAAPPNLPQRAKKFIYLGWVTPDLTYLRDHTAEVEKQPFDGLMLTLPDGAGDVFRVQKWNAGDFEKQTKPTVDALKAVRWKKFDSNFLAMHAASDMDWFSDSDWEKVAQRAAWMARLARESDAQLMWDSEPYGSNPWEYKLQKHAGTKSFSEYESEVRKRGAQFMRALTKELPDLKLFTLFQTSILSAAMDLPPTEREAALRDGVNYGTRAYGLTAAFLNGMLDAAGPRVVIIDGNEGSYYYTETLDFYRDYRAMKSGALSLIAPENQRKYQSQVQAAYSIYWDTTMGDYDAISRAVALADRLRRLQHNAYHAFAATDEYVWLYAEKADVWNLPDVPAAERNVTPDFWKTIAKAREEAAAHQPLDFEVRDLVAPAQARLDEAAKNIAPRTAKIARIETGARPQIDGKLDDAIYQKLTPLDGFSGLASTFEDAGKVAPTQSWIGYDDENLYVAFRAAEPLLGEKNVLDEIALRGYAAKRDQPAGAHDDTLEVVLSPGETGKPLFRFGVNAKNVGYDLRGGDASFNADWQSAVGIEAKAWTAEFAIPWSALGLKNTPAPGTTFRANLNRRRTPSQSYYVQWAVMSELSSWSQALESWNEPARLGTWTF